MADGYIVRCDEVSKMIRVILLGLSVIICQLNNCLSEPSGTNSQDNSKIVKANNIFAFSLYKTLISSKGNIFTSPISLSTSLSMLYLGAEGRTKSQIEEALGYKQAKVDTSRLPSSYKELLALLNAPKDRYTLKIANAMMLQSSFDILPSYENKLATFYDALLKKVDFTSGSSAAMQEINDWVKEKTKGKIPSLLKKPPSPQTRLVLLNAIYFLGKWMSPFSKKLTRFSSFYNNGDRNSPANVSMMFNIGKFLYAKDETLQTEAVRLPYEGKGISMLILLPRGLNGLSTLETKLRRKDISQLLRKMKESEVILYLPKFRLEYSKDMKDSLKNLKMKDVFDSSKADLSAITSGKNLFVSSVVHKAVIEVREDGSEAAGATAIEANSKSAIGHKEFHVNHPFMFFLIDDNTEMILFMGRVTQL